MQHEEFYSKVCDFKKNEIRRRVLAGESAGDIKSFLSVEKNFYENNSRLARTRARNFGELNRKYVSRRGYSRLSDYQMECALERAARPKNMAFATLIKRRLRETGKKQKDISDETGISPTQISKYAGGFDMPRYEKQEILLRALGLPHKTIEEALVAS